MTENILAKRKLLSHQIAFVVLLLLIASSGILVTPMVMNVIDSPLEIVTHLLWFVALPVMVSVTGFFLGWHSKKNAIIYSPVDYNFTSKQYTVQEMRDLECKHNRKYSRSVSTPTFWNYFIPILLIVGIVFIRLLVIEYEFLQDAMVLGIYAIALPITFAASSFGGWKATSNEASDDVNLRLIRETISLAREQESIPGVESLRIVIDEAKIGNVEIYENPRVVFRVSDISEHTFVETWSEEVGSAHRLYAKLLHNGHNPGTAFWWHSQDRYFQKSNSPKGDRKYVKSPLPYVSGEIGVKDIGILTKTAIALLALEWLRTREVKPSLIDVLQQLEVEYDM